MRTSGRKVTTWIAAAALAGLAPAAALFWKDVVVHYHYLRLREDPDLLAGMIEQPDEALKRAAARKYVETPEGERALRRTLARRMFLVAAVFRHGRPYERMTLELVGEGGGASYVVWSVPGRAGRAHSSVDLRVPLERYAGFIEMLGTFSTSGELSFREHVPGVPAISVPEHSLEVFVYRDPLEGGEERIGVRCDIARRSGR